MPEMRDKLRARFRRQSEFAQGYSPLYARLFGLVADWLTDSSDKDPLVVWLVATSSGRSSFDVPLLLMAGLHRQILRRSAGVNALARYFPTVGGKAPVGDEGLAEALRTAMVSSRSVLEQCLRTETVQTNESGRGLCWLLPVLYPGWKAVHLVELGASAGLNLVADNRSFRLVGSHGQPCLDLNPHPKAPPQFTVRGEGPCPLPGDAVTPRLLSRTGCDLHPLSLNSASDEHKLASFVWGDQVERMVLLQQGIAALHAAKTSQAPVRLHQAHLPGDLISFLDRHVGVGDEQPIVLFNTYLTTYLDDKGASLRPLLAEWARRRRKSLLWLQWETLWTGPAPPVFGWLGWTADLWQDGRHHLWHLAWVQPHGNEVRWLADLAGWHAFWQAG